MKRKKQSRGWVSAGTVVMLVLTAAVIAGFCALLPTFTGNQDIRLDASRLAVAIDTSLSQLSVSTQKSTSASQPVIPKIVWKTTPEPAAPSETAPPAAQPTLPPKRSFSFCAAGSVIWNAQVRGALQAGEEERFDLFTDQLTGVLNADLSIATLENTLISQAKLSDVNQPAAMLAPLASAGINALCVGHMSALNGGIAGLQETMQAISAAGMTPYGMHTAAAQAPVIRDCNGIRVALLSYQDEVSGTGRKQTSAEERAFAYTPIQLPQITADISRARENGAQVVVVSLCWGKEDVASPTDIQRGLAQAMADAGADIILGTHSSTLQPVQVLSAERGDGRYHPVLCAYSLGDLFTPDREKRINLASILLQTTVVYDEATGCVAFDDLRYTPTYSWRGKEDGQTLYRILLNNGGALPAFVDKDQQGVMERCLKLVREVMNPTGIPQAE